MVLAAVNDGPYQLMSILHILTAIVAFAPAFVRPILIAQAKTTGDRSALQALAGSSRRIYAPALIVTGVLGFGLSGMSEDVFELSQTWLILAIVLWIAMNGVLHAVERPAEVAFAGGDDSAEGRLNLASGAIAVMLVVMVWLMIVKPGL
ncbi:MAG: CopD family protein [Actinomycetota bacterium]